MKERIQAILAPAKAKGLDTGCEFNGKFWEVWVGSHAGGRENGESLARFLMERHEKATQRAQGEPEPIPIPAFLHVEDEPEPATPDPRLDLQAARIAELEAALAKATQPDVTIPDFLRYDPLAEFLANEQRDGETDEITLQRLRDELLDYLTIEAGGGGLTAPEEARKRLLSANIKPTGD